MQQESEVLREMRDRFRYGMMTKEEAEEVEAQMQEVFTFAEARALQGRYLIATQDVKDEHGRLQVPVNHSVQVVGLDVFDEYSAIIAVQYGGQISVQLYPKLVLMNKTSYEAHFSLA